MSLPYILFESAMAESPDGKGLLLFGGTNGTANLETIVELGAGAQWAKI